MATLSPRPAKEPRSYLNPMDVAEPILADRLDYVPRIIIIIIRHFFLCHISGPCGHSGAYYCIKHLQVTLLTRQVTRATHHI